MRLLLDTHALLWWIFDSADLSTPARRAIAEPDNAILVSSAAAWEIATKHRLGKLPDAGAVVGTLPTLLRRARFDDLLISLAHALEAGALPGPHKDPFDRMLIAQARLDDLTVVTLDPIFADYGVPALW